MIMASPHGEETEGVFDIEEIDGTSPSSVKHSSQSSETKENEASTSTAGINEDIELSRRAVPVVEVDEDVCSICLDDFTSEDPEQRTTCQCVPNHPLWFRCDNRWLLESVAPERQGFWCCWSFISLTNHPWEPRFVLLCRVRIMSGLI